MRTSLLGLSFGLLLSACAGSSSAPASSASSTPTPTTTAPTTTAPTTTTQADASATDACRLVDGTVAAEGDHARSSDGCNTCGCSGGHWACTEMLCVH